MSCAVVDLRVNTDVADYGAEVETSHVDFHIPIPGAPGDLLGLVFSTPMPEPAATAVLDLADAIADSLAWHQVDARQVS